MATLATARFRTAPKDVMRIALGSGVDEVAVDVLPPTKEIHEDMLALAAIVDDAVDGTLDRSTLDMTECLSVVGNALSRNTDLRHISAEYLEGIGFDMEDIADFLGLYLFFVKALTESKN